MDQNKYLSCTINWPSTSNRCTRRSHSNNDMGHNENTLLDVDAGIPSCFRCIAEKHANRCSAVKPPRVEPRAVAAFLNEVPRVPWKSITLKKAWGLIMTRHCIHCIYCIHCIHNRTEKDPTAGSGQNLHSDPSRYFHIVVGTGSVTQRVQPTWTKRW